MVSNKVLSLAPSHLALSMIVNRNIYCQIYDIDFYEVVKYTKFFKDRTNKVNSVTKTLFVGDYKFV